MVARIPPAIWLARRHQAKQIVLLSGPVEETFRYLMLIPSGRSFGAAMFLGTGWAAVEFLYVILGICLAWRRHGFKRNQELTGHGRTSLRAGLALASWERISASAFHLGASGLIAYSAVLTPVLAIVHSGINVVVLKLSKNVFVAQCAAFAMGFATFALAFLAWNGAPI